MRRSRAAVILKRSEQRIDVVEIAGLIAEDAVCTGSVADQIVALRGERAIEVRVRRSGVTGDNRIARIDRAVVLGIITPPISTLAELLVTVELVNVNVPELPIPL